MLSDSDPKIEAMMLQGYRAMTFAQKFERVQQLNEMVLQLAAARIQKQYGAMSDRELRLRLASLWIDRKTMIRAFDWDPDVHGL